MESQETDWRRRRLSANFSAADLLEAGETWATARVENKPSQEATWEALAQLCEEILEPIRAKFGPPRITYGFSSDALTRKIRSEAQSKGVHSHISPDDDQHAGHELKRNGDPVCKHLGQAVDFCVPGISSAKLALWMAEQRLPFDSLYFYGPDKPLHVSVGPKNRRSMWALLPTKSGLRGPPRGLTEAWLRAQLNPTVA